MLAYPSNKPKRIVDALNLAQSLPKPPYPNLKPKYGYQSW